MPLAELQRALAHLYTDEDARERFRRDAGAFARDFDLGTTELDLLSSIGDVRLHAYADSLDRKRANECARLLPLSAVVYGSAFRSEFLRYARLRPLGPGDRRYREDAAGFATFLLHAPGAGPARDLVRFEANPRAAVSFYRYFVPDLVRAVACGEPIDAAVACRTIVVRLFGRRAAFRLAP